jgi:hypothetical protein
MWNACFYMSKTILLWENWILHRITHLTFGTSQNKSFDNCIVLFRKQLFYNLIKLHVLRLKVRCLHWMKFVLDPLWKYYGKIWTGAFYCMLINFTVRLLLCLIQLVLHTNKRKAAMQFVAENRSISFGCCVLLLVLINRTITHWYQAGTTCMERLLLIRSQIEYVNMNFLFDF